MEDYNHKAEAIHEALGRDFDTWKSHLRFLEDFFEKTAIASKKCIKEIGVEKLKEKQELPEHLTQSYRTQQLEKECQSDPLLLRIICCEYILQHMELTIMKRQQKELVSSMLQGFLKSAPNKNKEESEKEPERNKEVEEVPSK